MRLFEDPLILEFISVVGLTKFVVDVYDAHTRFFFDFPNGSSARGFIGF